jgi:deoxycytidine triphosphate deaminase
MSHLPRQEILKRVQRATQPLIENVPTPDSAEFNKFFQPDSVDLKIGVVVARGKKMLDSAQRTWDLSPGEMAVIITKELLNVPDNMAGEVGPMARILSEGLLVLAASHVDPGYRGPLTARVINLLDTPYTLKFDERVLTLRFYKLESDTDRSYTDNKTYEERVEEAVKESRKTFNRVLFPEEDLVFKKDLNREAIVHALKWLAILVPPFFVALPVSFRFFWELGEQLYKQNARWVMIAGGILFAPLIIIYLIQSIKFIGEACHKPFWEHRG